MSTKNYLTIDLSNITEQDAVDQPIVRIETIEREVKKGKPITLKEAKEMAERIQQETDERIAEERRKEAERNEDPELTAASARIAELKAELKAARETIADKQAWIERAAKEAAKQNAELEARLKEACAKIEHQRNWYGCRSQRLQQFAKEEMSEAQQERFFSIMANGTADANEPPTYAQQYNMLKERAEQAEARLKEAEGEIATTARQRDEWVDWCKAAEARAESYRGWLEGFEVEGLDSLAAKSAEEARHWGRVAAAIHGLTLRRANTACEERRKAEADAGRLKEANTRMHEDIEALENVADLRRIALEQVEYHQAYTFSCPWCFSLQEDGHKPDCARQAALSPAAPAEQPAEKEDCPGCGRPSLSELPGVFKEGEGPCKHCGWTDEAEQPAPRDVSGEVKG